MSEAGPIEETAMDFLIRRTEEGWSAQDEQTLADWLAVSFDHKAAFWRLEGGLESVGRMAALRTPTPPQFAANDRLPFRRWWTAAAAAAAILVPSGAYWASHNVNLAGSYATEIGGRETVPLADGTAIDLNTATRLRTDLRGREREAWLDQGEAYFEVAHDPRRPFVVHAGPKIVTVLGTKFLVRRAGDRVEVGVVEGKVRVENAEHPAHALLSPTLLTRGEMIVGDGESTMRTPSSVAAVNDDLAWRDGMVTFDETTLADAANEFNRYNTRPLDIEGDARNIRISGSFEARNTAVFAELLHRGYGLDVKEIGGHLKIIR